MTITVPYMITPDEVDLRGKTGLIFGGLSIVACIWTYFCLPEAKGRTFEDLDHTFEQKIAARKFAQSGQRPHNAWA
jgi:SP family general alpha glucoside:H+ symporter-like MFS transporter